jgi:hypothetical protein
MLKPVKILVLGMCVLMTACATQPKSYWYKQNTSNYEFENDQAACNAQVMPLSRNLLQMAVYHNQCMVGKGWRIVSL